MKISLMCGCGNEGTHRGTHGSGHNGGGGLVSAMTGTRVTGRKGLYDLDWTRIVLHYICAVGLAVITAVSDHGLLTAVGILAHLLTRLIITSVALCVAIH